MSRFLLSVLSVLIVVALAPVARAENLAEDVVRATFRVIVGAASGTGFVVALDGDAERPMRHVFVTAAHVFDDKKATQATLIFRVRGKNGTFARKEIEVPLRDGAKNRWVRHAEMDVAVLPFELPEGIDVRPFRMSQIATAAWAEEGKVRVGQDVFIPCFPAQLEANSAGWPILRKGSIATHPLTPLAAAKTVYLDYSAFGGDSGAPVVTCTGPEPVVVGLVTGMQRQTNKVTMAFEERTVHMPLGLSIAVQSPYIRETIDRLAAK